MKIAQKSLKLTSFLQLKLMDANIVFYDVQHKHRRGDLYMMRCLYELCWSVLVGVCVCVLQTLMSVW